MHGLRAQYQDRVNFVVLDYDLEADYALAQRLGVAAHPAFATLAPGGDAGQVQRRIFGPQTQVALTALLDELASGG